MRREQLVELITEYAATREGVAGADPNLCVILGGPMVDAAPEVLRVMLQAQEGLCDDPVCINCPPLRLALDGFWARATGGLEPDTRVPIATFEHQPSSNIAGIGYDAPSRTLQVDFKNGGRYRYGNVSPEQARPLLHRGGVPSVGGYVVRELVRKTEEHPFVKMIEVGVAAAELVEHPGGAWHPGDRAQDALE